MRSGNLFVISGPSGAGKGTLVALLLRNVPDTWLSVSVTTRPPREGEIDGVTYHFIDEEEFERLVENDELLEWAGYTGKHYGTPRIPVEEHLANNEQVILEIEVQGAFQIKEKCPEAHMVFIEPPSIEELRNRLINRGTEDSETIERRIETAKVELAQKMKYDVCILNDVLENAASELIQYVNSIAEE